MNYYLRYFKFLFRKDTPRIIIAFIAVIVIRLIRPFVTIRVARWALGSRIGHLASEPDIYIAKEKWSINDNHEKNILYLYYIPGRDIGGKSLIPNQFLYKLVEKKIPTLKYSQIISWIEHFNSKLFKVPHIKAFEEGHCDKNVFTARTPSPYIISKKDINIAQKKAKLIGIDDKESILLFFNRDSVYISDYFKTGNDQYNEYRNSLIQSYIPMANFFAKSGYKCIRMGAITEKKIKQHSNILDLSSYPRDELLEFYLFSIAKFSVSDCTGLNQLTCLFRKPRVIVNGVPLMNFIVNGFFHQVFDSIMIFKTYWCLDENKILSVSEIKKKGLLNSVDSNDYIKNNIKVIDNTPEEILEASLEMHQRLNNEWVETEENILLQHRFWNQFDLKRDFRFLSLYPRVGAHFLRNNEWLLK